MNQHEWAKHSEPRQMWHWVAYHPNSKVLISSRRARLYACACARLLYPLLEAGEPGGREYIEELLDAVGQAEREADDLPCDGDRGWLFRNSSPFSAATNTVADLARSISGEKMALACDLLRELVGDPWRPVRRQPVTGGDWVAAVRDVEAEYLREAHVTPLVSSLALAAYEKRREDGFLDGDILAVLADALEEAGCESGRLLTHLRGHCPCPAACCRGVVKGNDRCVTCPRCVCGVSPLGTPHAAGCWAVDLILGNA